MRIRMFSVVLVAAVSALAIAGCGNDSKTESKSDDTDAKSASSMSTTTTTSASPPGHHDTVTAPEGVMVRLKAMKDAKSGYNFHIETEDFSFTPEDVNGERVSGAGHAHLYVDGKKLGRLYAEWFYLGDVQLSPGEHEVRVTLNANDHADYVDQDGKQLEATATVTMDEGAAAMGGANAAAGSMTTGDGDTKTIDVAIHKGQPKGGPTVWKLKRGERFRIVVSSDAAHAVHLHAPFDIEREVEAGGSVTIEATADDVGSFELEIEETATLLGNLEVR